MKQKVSIRCLVAIGQLKAVVGELQQPEWDEVVVLETLLMAQDSIKAAIRLFE